MVGVIHKMENKLIKTSLSLGSISWLTAICGSLYFYLSNINVSPDPLAIFKPGVFETLNIVLLCAIISGIGFVIGILSKARSRSERKPKIIALVLNALFCIPIGITLLAQALMK